MMDQELLISASRVIDREAGEEDWARLEQAAKGYPRLWEELGSMMQDDSRIRLGTSRRMAGLASTPTCITNLDSRRRWRSATITLFSGIVAIAALLVAFTLGRSVGSHTTPELLLSEYLERGESLGRVLDELPNQTLEIREAPAGEGIEVIFLRRILERAIVREAWQLGSNEYGEPSADPVSLESLRRTSSY